VKGAVYEDADGAVLEQLADVFVLACGAVESARSASHCRSTGVCPVGLCGEPKRSRSTGTTSTTPWPCRWSCTICPSTTTGSSSTRRSRTPGACRWARITLRPHPNDIKQGRLLIDRDADILEAAGASKVHKVYIDRITGNCSHQHGTTRMGDDPQTSVLDRWCRAHEVDNLFVVDGGPFPTGTGANPRSEFTQWEGRG
jgi:hypothetical protein